MTEPVVPAPAPAAPVAKWNVLSIVSLVTSIIGFSLVGVITGHIALSQIKKTGEQGNVLAIIGLILGYIGLVAFIIFIIVWVGIFAAATSVQTY
ncbi:DUF4190 domain-containing protein [Schumannella luteola]